MATDWEKAATIIGGVISTVVTVLGTWYLKILSRKSKIAEEDSKRKLAEAESAAAIEQQKLAATKAEEKQERQDANEEAWVLIRRLQEIIKEHAEELSKLKAEYEACLTACENRERGLMKYTAALEKEYGRMLERIRFYEARLSQIKGWNLPPFEEPEVEKGTGVHKAMSQHAEENK